METGAPLWTPVPVSEISLASVVCRAPINPFMAPKPFSKVSPLQVRGDWTPNPPSILPPGPLALRAFFGPEVIDNEA